ncbi:type IV toxin-antitoxin system AbiEi family antitoxin domain-containing protein [Modestobacter roseus]|uniref:Transcriptional regulator with AbiEi antitoxin domain of type IV toxin-antitoxin system n=1 Tax=Modestobacter roseus TaxID=1181884 RepID=A0A562IRG5_9ACTN|nr:type IV toxin-antitoxin system AbiEi family antitoxin [Modestobacter roseus]TWH73629.1 transcriptional regulator with AbiEi antitoxin domain of type IV toxin-antitoxin system [Modestobacter roseus]
MAGALDVMTRAPLRTVRPRDLAAVYTQPNVQLTRLTRQGRVRKVAAGLYYALPDDRDPAWLPTLEAAAAGAATALYGDRVPVLMHVTAARLHGALPRAITQAVVAVPAQHRALQVLDRPTGVITFVTRDVEALDAVLVRTDLGPALVTTPEQTVLDLTKRPALAGMPGEVRDAVRTLLPRCAPDRLDEIAREQRMGTTLARLRAEHP